jgi:hypothetical protein
VPKAGLTDAQLQANLDYACGQGIDCSLIQPGGACFEPNTLANHAAYAMNLFYHTVGQNPLTCDFSQTATLTSTNPSKFSRCFCATYLLFLSLRHIQFLCSEKFSKAYNLNHKSTADSMCIITTNYKICLNNK